MKKKLLIAIASAFALTTPLVQAASDYLLELDGIKGESAHPEHSGAIEIQSWSWGVSNSGAVSGGGGGAGKVSLQDFHFTCSAGKATPKLMLACATGQHIKKAVLHVRKSGGDGAEYIKVTLEDILVSSVAQTGRPTPAADPKPTEQVSLNFTKITYEYISDDGSSETATVEAPSDPAGN